MSNWQPMTSEELEALREEEPDSYFTYIDGEIYENFTNTRVRHRMPRGSVCKNTFPPVWSWPKENRTQRRKKRRKK